MRFLVQRRKVLRTVGSGRENGSVCFGDSGNPVLCVSREKDRSPLAPKCKDEKSSANVFTNARNLLPEIRKIALVESIKKHFGSQINATRIRFQMSAGPTALDVLDLFKSNGFSRSSYESIKEERLVVCILLFQLLNLAMRIAVFFAGCLLNLLALDFSAKTNVASAMQPPGVAVRTAFGDDDEVAARRDYNSEGATCGKAPLNKYSSIHRNGLSEDLAESDDNISTNLRRGAYIVHGAEQTYGEWPSFAIINSIKGKYMNFCGGTLIGRRHVLTAAHCMSIAEGSNQTYLPQEVTVKLGKHNVFREDSHEQVYNVSDICVSRVYSQNVTASKEDFAVLTLARSVETFNDYVQPACLPSKVEGVNTKRGNCWAVGAGGNRVQINGSEAKYTLPERVQKLQVVEASCRDWQKVGVKDNSRSHICFSKTQYREHGSVCIGDSGGPILCNSGRGRWTVVGITSQLWISCDGPHFANLFTNVAGLETDIRSQCGWC